MNYAIALTVVVNTVLASSELCPSICDQQRSRPKYNFYNRHTLSMLQPLTEKIKDILRLFNAKILSLCVENRLKSLN